MNSSSEVDAWFATYQNPQKPLVEEIRRLMLAADPRLGECIKWQAPTFVYKGNLASFFPRAKAYASLMFHTGAQIPGRYPSLTGAGQVARQIRIMDKADLADKAEELATIVVAWCDWRDGVV